MKYSDFWLYSFKGTNKAKDREAELKNLTELRKSFGTIIPPSLKTYLVYQEK